MFHYLPQIILGQKQGLGMVYGVVQSQAAMMAFNDIYRLRALVTVLMIPSFLHRAYDAFWLEFIGGTAASCGRSGTDLVVSAVDAAEQMNHGFKRLVRGRRVDGVLLCDLRQHDPRIRYLQKHQLPFVAFGRTREQHDSPYFDVDGTAGVTLS